MQTISIRHYGLNAVSLLLLLPAAWFFGINFLNELGVQGPYNASLPVLERLGIGKPLGLNVNLLILLGPVTAILIAAGRVLHIEWQFSKEQFRFVITIRRKWFPLFIAFSGAWLLACLFFYLATENF